MVRFMMPHKVVLTFLCVEETLVHDHSNEIAIEKYFLVVLFIMPHKAVLIFLSVDETLVCDHSNESY